MAARSIAVADDTSRKMLIAQYAIEKTRAFGLGGGFGNGDGGDYGIGFEELEEQVPGKGGRANCGRPPEARILLRNIIKIKRRFLFFLPPRC